MEKISNNKKEKIEKEIERLISYRNILEGFSETENWKTKESLRDISLKEEIEYVSDWIEYYSERKKKLIEREIKPVETVIKQTEPVIKPKIEYSEKKKELAEQIKPQIGYYPKKKKTLIDSLIKPEISSNFTKAVILTIVLTLIIAGILFIKPLITGYVTVTEEISYNQTIDETFTADTEYIWFLEHAGNLRSIKLNGEISKDGYAEVYLLHNGIKYTVFDSDSLTQEGLVGITGLVVYDETNQSINETTINETIINESLENISIINQTNESVINETTPTNESNETIINENISIINKSITINLEYKSGTIYDPEDDGKEPITGIIDFAVEDTKFNWNIDFDKLCTRWETYSLDSNKITTICNGDEECCGSLIPIDDSWDSVFYSNYEKYGAGFENIISARVIYYDVDLAVPKADIYYSNWSSLNATYYEERIIFNDICIDTCLLTGFNETFYTLIINVSNATLMLDSIDYSVLEEIEEIIPVNITLDLIKDIPNITIAKNNNETIDLSQYFSNIDDNAIFTYYETDNITILFDNNIATIIPAKDFIGKRFTFITASKNDDSVVSNVISIDVIEPSKIKKIEYAQFEFLGSTGESEYLDGGSGISVVGDVAYGASRNILSTWNVSDPSNPFLMDSDDSMDSGWVYALVVRQEGDNIFAYVSEEDILWIFNVTDPNNIGGYLDYQYIDDYSQGLKLVDDVAYVVGSNNIYTFDITEKYTPEFAELDSFGVSFGRPEDIDVEDGILYVAFRDGLYIFDVSDPSSISYISNLSRDSLSYMGEGGGIDVVGGVAYYTGNTEDVFVSINVSDVSNPVVMNYLNSSESNITGGHPYHVRIHGDVAYVPVDTTHKVISYDISDPYNLKYLDEIGGKGSPNYLEGAWRIFVEDNSRIYVGTYSDYSITILSHCGEFSCKTYGSCVDGLQNCMEVESDYCEDEHYEGNYTEFQQSCEVVATIGGES